MSLKIPQNQIKYKYTSGGEYIIANSNIRYQGYYYEVNGKTYTGKEYNASGSTLLIKDTPDNSPSPFLNTTLYEFISNVKVNKNLPQYITYNPSQIESSNSSSSITRYFIKKVNDTLIKEINKTTFDKFNSDPLYQKVAINFTFPFVPNPDEDIPHQSIPQNLTEAEKTMPGITLFLYNNGNNSRNNNI